MDLYKYSFIFLVSICGFLTWKQYKTGDRKPEETSLKDAPIMPRAKAEVSQFTRLFLTVYCLVMGADWLQGPYVYSLYKDQFGLRESIVAALFTTGFLSGGVTGYFVGQFADRYGRKTACLIFCVTYSISCFSTLVPRVPVLFAGRVFGGLSTSLMYSAFESWMVTEYHRRQLDKRGLNLSSMYGIMTTLNSVVAIFAGVSSEWLVQITSTKRAPFMASAGLLIVAFWIILMCWNENYGDSHQSGTSGSSSPSGAAPAKNVLGVFFSDKRILTLGLASCFFEGSMYLFVFFWTPALKAAHSQSNPSSIDSLPFGLIFASFMASVMLGSLLFNLLIPTHRLITPTRLLVIIFATASSTLLIPVLTTSEPLTFLSFCIFEACVGMYWPSVGFLKGRVIEDGVRARIYGMLRIPLNIFVVVALALVRDDGGKGGGDGSASRNLVFVVCSGLLVFVGGIFGGLVGDG